MKSRIIPLIVVFVLLLSTITTTAAGANSSPKTITVPDDYKTIQEAIDAANSGDTIAVKAGIYNEEWVSIEKSVSVIGDNQKSVLKYHSSLGLIVTADNVHINGFTVTGFDPMQGYAISVSGAKGCVITNNQLKDNLVGISVYGASSRNTVSENVVTHNNRSIELINAHNNMITENNITAALISGISLDESTGNTISKNRISELADGMGALMLWKSSNNTVTKNLLNKGTLSILVGSTGNTISENFVIKSTYGVYVGQSSGNKFYRNYFLDVNQPVLDSQTSPDLFSENSWDNGIEGNYWSDYNGTDTDNNGIGDFVYLLYGNNQDNYPLMDFPAISTEPEALSKPSTQNRLPSEIIIGIVVIAIIISIVATMKLRKK
ncbi:MAG: NosD domain-containing protein [Candidatus Bathyarchaeota archaeon]|nr:NosD domain-containing protein [Candidatus Bathyarchaeum tardum]WGM89477.1 MAG: NosD domain-containing protein [Candidatus Bathyarchaeum tardum]